MVRSATIGMFGHGLATQDVSIHGSTTHGISDHNMSGHGLATYGMSIHCPATHYVFNHGLIGYSTDDLGVYFGGRMRIEFRDGLGPS